MCYGWGVYADGNVGGGRVDSLGGGFSVDIAVVVRGFSGILGDNLGAADCYAYYGLWQFGPLGGGGEGRDSGDDPEAEVVDITHKVIPFDLLDGAMAIGLAYKYFPPKTFIWWW